MSNGSEETADPQPAERLGYVFGGSGLDWFYSHGLYRRCGNAGTNRCLFGLVVSGARECCERRERVLCRLAHQAPVKARTAAEGGAGPEHGGGWGASARSARVGGNGLYGVPGEAGSSCAARSAVAARGRGRRYRTLHHAKSTPNEGTGSRLKLSTSIRGGRGGVR